MFMENKNKIYEEEAETRFQMLTPFDIALVYIEDKNTGMIRIILNEYQSYFENVKTDQKRFGLSWPISQLKQALRKLNSRTEEEEENDLIEQEYLQKAMYG